MMTTAQREAALAYYTAKKRAYIAAFAMPPHGQAVLDDLAVFCRANETCVVRGDRDATCVLEGRREAFLRIRDFLDSSPEELVTKLTKITHLAEALKPSDDDSEK